MRPMKLPLSIVLLAVVLPACAADPPPSGIAPPTRIPDAPTGTSPAGETISTSAMPRPVRRAVVADAARRFRVAASAVVLAHAERVTWNDGGLGCAAPGEMVTQALVPGFRVVAKTPAGAMTYHTDGRGRVVPCAPARPPQP